MKLVVSVLLAVSCSAQGPVFEVATVKPSANLRDGYGINNTPGGFRSQNTTLQQLICYALGVQDFQVTGGPSWINSAHFDVNASNGQPETPFGGPSDVKGNEARIVRIRARVMHLLEERFQLELRKEQREVPVYALSVEKGGHKMTPVADPLGNTSSGGTSVRSFKGSGMTMERLIQSLSGIVQRPVIDETGLTGAFDLEIKYAPDSVPQDAVSDAPMLFTAIKEQLGLKLTGKKAMTDAWVVVKAEKPTEN